MFRTTLATATLLLNTVYVSAAEPPQGAVQVQQWIAELDHDQFKVRDAATAKLIEAGHVGSLVSLVRTVESGSPEARSRAVLVLRNWFQSSDAKNREAARATADEWKKAKDPRVVWLGQMVVAKQPSLLAVPPRLPVFG